MLKDILLRCSLLLDRDDLYQKLKTSKNIEDIEDLMIKSDVVKLIDFYNFVINFIYENYVEIVDNNCVLSDKNGCIFYENLNFKPIKIISVSTENNQDNFLVFPSHIKVSKENYRYNVEYRYVPEERLDLDDELFDCENNNENIVCMGIVSKFLAAKGKYNESEFWNNKFMFELFNKYSKKERRLKPHFVL